MPNLCATSKFSLIVSITGQRWQMITVQVWIDGKDKEVLELDANAKCIDVKNLVAEKHYRGVQEITVLRGAEEVGDDVLLKDLDLGSSNWLVCTMDKIIEMGTTDVLGLGEEIRRIEEIMVSALEPMEEARRLVMVSFNGLMNLVMSILQRIASDVGRVLPMNFVMQRVVEMLDLNPNELFERYRDIGELMGEDDEGEGEEDDNDEFRF